MGKERDGREGVDESRRDDHGVRDIDSGGVRKQAKFGSWCKSKIETGEGANTSDHYQGIVPGEQDESGVQAGCILMQES